MKKFPISLVLLDIRSLYNVGSLFRLADCAGIEKIYLVGATGYPKKDNDSRKPWDIEATHKKIAKTALGAEETVEWEYFPTLEKCLENLRSLSITIVGIEDHPDAVNIYKTDLPFPIALILGNEVAGIPNDVFSQFDLLVKIPMFGSKESLNVATAGAISTYELVRRLTEKG